MFTFQARHVELGQAAAASRLQLPVEAGDLLAGGGVEGVHLDRGHLVDQVLVHLGLGHVRHGGRAAVRPHRLQLVDHLLRRLALGVLLAAAGAALAHLADTAHDSEVPHVRLPAHRPQVVRGHGVAVLDAELLQRPHRVAGRRGAVGRVRDGRQRRLAVLRRHAPVQLVQHGAGGGVLGLLLAAAAAGGRQVAQDHLHSDFKHTFM